MKIRQSVGICISLGMLLSGCRSGMYSINTDGKSDSNKDKLPYRIVDALDPKSYSVDYLPVEVNVSKSKGSDDSVALCCLTLGIIPAFYDDYENYRVMVQTPIGTKLGTGSIHAKSWVGWICLIPYPGAADFRSNDPKLPDRVMEEKLKDELVEQLVSQFSKEEYVSYVKDLNEKREKEAKRVEQKVHEIEAFISAGKFEEAMRLCGEERVELQLGEPWLSLNGKAIKGFKDAVSAICDQKRLVAAFASINDLAFRESVVVRLNALKSIDALSEKELGEIIDKTTRNDVRIAAIRGIKNDSLLLSIAAKKHGDDVIRAAFSMISDRENVRNAVWAGDVDAAMARVYINTFASDDEFGKLIEKHPSKLTPEFVSQIKSKTTSPKIHEGISTLATKIIVEKITSEFVPHKGDKYNPRWFSFSKIVAALSNIADEELRADVALQVLRRGMEIAAPYDSEKYRVDIEAAKESGDEQKVWKLIEQYMSASRSHSAIVVYGDEQPAIFKFCEFLRQKDCEQIYDEMTFGHESGAFTMDAGYFAKAIIGRLSRKALEERVKVALARAEASGKIVFEGFYCGMPYKDFLLMTGYRKVIPICNEVVPEHWHHPFGDTVNVLIFKRKMRYALCDAEDGEFWSLFMRKYIPQKTKSLGEMIGDTIDKGSFDYQEVYDEKHEESCYIYKSLKYRVTITYGLRSGMLCMKTDTGDEKE